MAQDDFAHAWDEFFGSIRRARGHAAQTMEKEGLSLAQFQLLYAFVEGEGADQLTVGSLAQRAGIAQPTATRMLDVLERHGVIERRPSDEDRRTVAVTLTAGGRRTLVRKRKLVEEKRRAVFESLDPSDRKRAPQLLRALAAAIDD
jgi:DNA-binding MarR family transcriptional regulator